ncbi:hypothetical protein [Nostoc sp. C057]|uniref:hypothetical protein n=1 Tax=Nostoc sp. C057 TaxID=2576903 RepID=UPI0015C35207|nr:hypothetical protein [Nostoc sp. C057]
MESIGIGAGGAIGAYQKSGRGNQRFPRIQHWNVGTEFLWQHCPENHLKHL